MERTIQNDLQETNVIIEEVYKDVIRKYGKKPWYFQFPTILFLVSLPLVISLIYGTFTLDWLIPLVYSAAWAVCVAILFVTLSIKYNNKQFKELNIKKSTNRERFNELRKMRLNDFSNILTKKGMLKNDSMDFERINHYIHLMNEEQKYLHKEKTPMLGASLLLGISIAIFPELFKWILSKIREENMLLFWIFTIFILIVLIVGLRVLTNIYQSVRESLDEHHNMKKEIIRWLEIIKSNLIYLK